MIRFIATLLAASAAASGSAAAAQPAPAPPAIDEVLVLPALDRTHRYPLRVDPLEAALVRGAALPPRAGDVVAGPTGWTAWRLPALRLDAGVQDDAIPGGYVHMTVACGAADTWVLHACGHTMVYVNGEPRVGDPYDSDAVRLPIRLDAGLNTLLFHMHRPRLHVDFTRPEAELAFLEDDITAPTPLADEPIATWAAIPVVNAAPHWMRDARLVVQVGDEPAVERPLPPIAPLTLRKIPIEITHAPTNERTLRVKLGLRGPGGGGILDQSILDLPVVGPHERRRCTFISGVDGSVQAYAVVPPTRSQTCERPGLVLSLHGAGVEVDQQAGAYAPKDWAYIVCPSNRRPYGFNWEHIGRLDALEVLTDAQLRLGTDPRRTLLTGHSMGGHGVWHVAGHHPDRFAAIAPSAGWISYWSYVRMPRFGDDALGRILQRAANVSDTHLLLDNYASLGVFIFHGDQDAVVPVDEARTMRRELTPRVSHLAYEEKPGGSHWFGGESVDWPPLFAFIRPFALPERGEVDTIDFTCISPGVNGVCHWASIDGQERLFEPSRIQLSYDPSTQVVTGRTRNVERLSIEASALPGVLEKSAVQGALGMGWLGLAIDDQWLLWPAITGEGMVRDRVTLVRREGSWGVGQEEGGDAKQPARYGPFKEVFGDNFALVFGTRGDPAENAWALAKARFDAEQFWYQANASPELETDRVFDGAFKPDRTVVLYGHAGMNAAWAALFGDSPVQVARGAVRVGEREVAGDDFAVLAIHPRPRSATGLVGVVAGTGPAGLRLTERMTALAPSCHYPDFFVATPGVLEAAAGVVAAGFFAPDWGLRNEPSPDVYIKPMRDE